MPTRPRSRRGITALALTVLVTVVCGTAVAQPAQASSIVTPGDFTGYGFDQCTAPTQKSMNAWLRSSPYWAVGIYISGDSRGCRYQPDLTPTWVSTQLARGWRLLPVTLGPQAWCTTRKRYLHQVRIDPDPASRYVNARTQGRHEARKTQQAAASLGIAPGSTLWYDIEAFDTGKTDCRESALSFLSAWTKTMHQLGYVSGIYASGGSGVKMLDDARATRPGLYAMPDQLWVADWNNRASVDSAYVRSDGWMPRGRVHQYRGGHDERYGGVTINIDNDFLDLGKGSVPRPEPAHCGGVDVNLPVYRRIAPGTQRSAQVKAAQCLLREQRLYGGPVDGVYSDALGSVVKKFRTDHGLGAYPALTRSAWMALVTQGRPMLLKYGAAGAPVRRLQRALNAADSARLAVTGTFEGTTTVAVKRYQATQHLPATGVVTGQVWRLLTAGTR